jgi:hypothetical protein
MLIFATINEAHFVTPSTNVKQCELTNTAGGLRITDEPTKIVVRVPKTHNN